MGQVFPLQNLCSWGTSSRQWSTRFQGRGRETPPFFTLPQRDLEQGNDPTLPSLGYICLCCLSKPISNASFSLQTSSKTGSAISTVLRPPA